MYKPKVEWCYFRKPMNRQHSKELDNVLSSHQCTVQSYRMHLKSSNGAIDVLVCPEEEAECLHTPHPPISTSTNGLYTARSVYSVLDAPPPLPPITTLHASELVPDSSCSQAQQQQGSEHMQQPCALPLAKVDHRQQTLGLPVEQAISPSYPQVTVTGPNSDLDISLSSAADVTDDLGFMDRLLPLDMGLFDQLSPTLPTEDFSFSMDNSTEGISDLFDI